MAITVNTQEAKTQLSRLLKLVQEGEEVIVANRGVKIARISKYEPAKKRNLGFVKGSLPDSFFDPLESEDLESWGL